MEQIDPRVCLGIQRFQTGFNKRQLNQYRLAQMAVLGYGLNHAIGLSGLVLALTVVV